MSREKSPSDKVYNFILDKIVTRQWPVKTRIMTEKELCEHNQVSRMAVREAVERLSALGLLVKRQGAGTFVSDPRVDACLNPLLSMMVPNNQDLRHILEFRRSFECGNIGLFLKNSGPREIAQLEENYKAMVAIHKVDSEGGGVLDFEFHQIIALGTKNTFISRIADILVSILQSHQNVLYMALSHDNAIVYHKEIIRCLKRGDAEAAELFMRRHIDIVIERLNRKIEAEAKVVPDTFLGGKRSR